MSADVRWPAKLTGETIWATFFYQGALCGLDSVASAAVTVELVAGSDADPAALLDGAPVLLANGRVMQRLSRGCAGAAYRIRCVATTLAGQVFPLSAILPVKEMQ